MNNLEVFNYEMGYTQHEFGRVLNSGFTNHQSPYRCQPVSTNGWLVTQLEHPLQVSILLTPLSPRVLGSISLPVLQVKFSVKDATKQQSDDFFDKLFKYFHKGGG